MEKPSVLISVLNWNKAQTTLKCLSSLLEMERDGMRVDVLVIDNGSEQADYVALRDAISADWMQVRRIERNLGFTGGQNESLKVALEKQYDFVWMLNNDATVLPDTLVKLVRAIRADDRCGAVSPVISPGDDGRPDNAWGFTQDWKTRNVAWIESEAESRELHERHPERISLAGTAILLRVQAIREVGLLDDRLFAYFDDNDLGARLAKGGWRSKVVFEATTTHGLPELTERPLYFFYLMYRNELFFWHTNMPQEFRKLLWLKLINQALFNANRLRRRGMHRQADVALLGIFDFIRGKGGPVNLARKVPAPVQLLSRAAAYLHRKQLQATSLPSATEKTTAVQ